MTFRIFAPVQQDRTGDSMAALMNNIRTFAGPEPVAREDLERAINSSIYALPGAFETSGSVLGALETIAMLGRPDDYYVRLPARYREQDQQKVTRAVASLIDPGKLQWVVVGDAKLVEPQLRKLGLPVEVRAAP
jgi:predicted Zn-dependent peptidase